MQCENVKECSCPSTNCANHGKCCACVVNHRGGSNLPYCLRDTGKKAKEKK